ncbi:MAG: carbohydrate ABC transporter permease [Dehalococcoidia bacterium]
MTIRAKVAATPATQPTTLKREEERSGAGPLSLFGKFLSKFSVHVILILIIVAWSVPTFALLVSSFREPADIARSGWWNALTGSWSFTLDNYDQVLSQRNMGRAFMNSLIISVPSTILSILVAAMAAYAFAWMRFPGRNMLFLLVVGMLVVPVQMTLIPVLRIYGDVTVDTQVPIIGGNLFGINSFPGMWVAHTAYGLPFAIFLLRNFFAALPRDLFESAYLDGASEVQVFFKIVLPLSGPALAALGIFQFLWIWNDLLIALIYMGDPELAPMTLAIRNLVSSFGTQYQFLTAAAFISMALPLLIFFALQRYFVQGVLAGSVKG